MGDEEPVTNGQSTLDGDCLPPIDVLTNSSGKSSRKAYNTYYVPIYKQLQQASSTNPVSTDTLFDVIDCETSDDTKWKYVSDVLRYDPSLAERISNRLPPSDVLVEVGAQRIGKTRQELRGRDVNAVQKSCQKFAEEVELTGTEYAIGKVISSARDRIPSPTEVDEPERFFDELQSEMAKESSILSQEMESIKQGMVASGGESNEIIITDSLANAGLQPGVDFERVNNEKKYDVDIWGEQQDPLRVEIKSIGVRERADAGLSRIDDPSLLVGFFDSVDELESRHETFIDVCEAVYLPPLTIQNGSSLISEPFYRPNTRFAYDMKQYTNGEIEPWLTLP